MLAGVRKIGVRLQEKRSASLSYNEQRWTKFLPLALQKVSTFPTILDFIGGRVVTVSSEVAYLSILECYTVIQKVIDVPGQKISLGCHLLYFWYF